MTDKPISFQAPMIRALLDERKSQTRRMLGFQPGDGYAFHHFYTEPAGVFQVSLWSTNPRQQINVYSGRVRWEPGDRLWVKERGAVAASGLAFQHYVGNEASMEGGPKNPCWPRSPDGTPYKPRVSIHMPRWASRLTLFVSDVRVQRLQEISEEDAIAEGMQNFDDPGPIGAWWPEHDGLALAGATAREGYALLWDKINGRKPEARWEANPWIVALTFRVIKQNIDAIGDDAHDR